MCGPHHHSRVYQPIVEEHTATQPAGMTVGQTRPCPTCERPVQEDFVLCPYCGTQLKRSCPSCARAVDVNWNVCPYCGTDLTES